MDDQQVTLRRNRRRVLQLALIPLLIFILLLLLFGIWRFSSSGGDDAENPVATQSDQPVNEISLFELQTLQSPELAINDANQLVVNGELTANGAFIINESAQPADPKAGQVFFDQDSNEVRYYDGDKFLTIVGIEDGAEICFVGDDCGFLGPDDLIGLSVPNPVNVTNLTDNAVLLGNGTGQIQTTAEPTPGQILVGSSAGVPTFRTITGDVSINAGGNIQLVNNSVTAAELSPTTVSAGTYGSGTDYPVFTVDADGRITSASTLPVPGGGGGVTALNTLTGALTIAGTANQITVSPAGSTITLSTPQDIATTSSPTFAGLNLTGNLSVDGNTTLGNAAADTISINGTLQGGTPLVFEGSSADAVETSFVITDPTGVDKTITFPDATGEVSLLGQSILTGEIQDGTILFADVGQNGCSSGDVMEWNGAAWACDADDTGAAGSFTITDGVTPQTLNNGDTLTFNDGTNADVVVSAPDTVTVNVIDNPTFAGLVTLNGSAVVQIGDTLTINGDAFSDLTGAGLQINAGSLETLIGATVEGSEITDGTIEADDLENTIAAGPGVDNYVLTYDDTTEGFTWVDPATVGTTPNLFETFSTPGGTSPVADTSTDTFTFANGTNIQITGTAATDTVSVAVADAPTFSGLVTLNGNALLEVGDTFTINGEAFNDLTGSGLARGISGALTLGALTTDWTQSGAFDIILDNASSELQIRGDGGAFYATLDAGTLTGNETFTFAPGTAGSLCTTAGNCVGAGGGAAPSDAEYLVLSLDGSLSDERLLNPGTSLTVTDNGANGNFDIDTVQDIRTTAAPEFATINTGNGNQEVNSIAGFLGDQNLRTTDAPTFATINTGNGAQEVNTIAAFLGNQDLRTTDSPTFASPTFTGTLAVQGASVTLGTASTTNGAAIFQNATNAFGVTVNAPNQTVGSATISLPDTAGVADSFCLATLGNCAGAAYSFDISDGSTTQTIASGNTINFNDGTDTNLVVSAVDDVTVNLTSTLASVTGRGATTTTLVNLDGGIAVDTTNFTVSGTNGDVVTAGDLAVNGGNITSTGALAIDLGGGNDLTVTDGTNTLFTVADGGTVGNVTTTGTLAVNGASATIGTASTTSGTLTLLNASNAFSVSITAPNQTVGSATISLPDTAGVADTFCLSTLGNCAGSAQNLFQTIDAPAGTDAVADSATDTLTLANGTNVAITGSDPDTLSFAVIDNPTFAGLVTLNGNALLQTGDTLTIDGEAFDQLTGNGLAVASGDLQLGALTANYNQTGAFDIVLDNASSELQIRGDGGAFYATLDAGTLTGNETFTLEAGSAGNICTDAGNCVGGGGGGSAPSDAEFLVLSLDGDLSDERVFVDGNGLTLTDGGANGNATLALGPLTSNWDQTGAFDISLNNASSELQILESVGGTFFGILDVGNLTGNTTVTIEDGSTGNICTDAGNCVGGGAGGSAPNDAQYLTLAFDGDLSAERRLDFNGTNFSVTDNGADADYDVNTIQDIATTSSPTFASPLFTGTLQVQGASVSVGQASTTDGTLVFLNDTNAFTTTIDVTDATANRTATLPDASGEISLLGQTIGNSEIESDAVALGTQTTGNYVATISAGNGISGSSAAEGGTPTIALGPLTADWNQTGAFDIILDNASSELLIRGDGGAFYAALDAGTLTGNETFTLEAGSAGNICTDAGNCLGGAGGAAPNDAEYLVLSLDGDLSAERLLNPGTSLTVTDNGANGNFDIDTIQDIRTTANPEFATINTGNGNQEVNSIAGFLGDQNLRTTDAPTFATIDTGNGAQEVNTIAGFLGNQDLRTTDSPTFASPTFTGTLGVQGASVTVGTASSTSGNLVLLNSTNAFSVSVRAASQTVGSAVISIPDTAGANDTLCLSTLGNCAGAAQNVFETINTPGGTDPIADSSTDTLNLSNGTNIDIQGASGSDTITFNVIDNPTFAGLVTLNGNALLQNGDTLTVNGDAFTDFTGNGLAINSGILGLGPLTANWDQTGAFDISLNNASSELQILESNGGTFFGVLDVGDLTGNTTISIADGSTGDICTTAGNCVGAGGGAAPNDAEYLVLTLDGDLSAERLLNPGNSIAVTDNGANGNYDIDTVQDIRVTAAPTFATIDTGNGAQEVNTIAGFLGDQNLRTTDSPTFANGTLTGILSVNGATATIGTASATDGGLVLLNSTNAFGVTINAPNQTVGAAAISLPDTAGAADTFCLSTLANCAGVATTLQGAYDNDADGSDTIIALTAADDSLIFRNPAASGTDSGYILTLDQLSTGAVGGLNIESAGTGNILVLRDTTATAQDVLTVADGGAVTLRNQTDSTAALQVLDADGGTSIFTIDSINERVGIGVDDPSAPLEVQGDVVVSRLSDGGDAITFREAGSYGTTADILFSASGGIAAESSLLINIDTLNNGTSDVFSIRCNGEGLTSCILFELTEAGDGTLAGALDVQGSAVTIGESSTTDGSLVFLNDTNGFSTTVDVADATANRTITFPDASGDVCLTSGNCVGAGGGSAPNDAQYLTLALDGDLTGERLLNPGTSLTVTDNGANGNYDINTIQDIRVTAAPEFATINTGNGNQEVNTIAGFLGDQNLRTTDSPTFAAGTFTSTLDVQGASVTIGQATATDGTLIFENDTNAFSTTFSINDATANRIVQFPDQSGTVCLTTGNCSGVAGNNLQQAYDADADGGDSIIALTSSDDSLIFRNPAAAGTDSSYILTLDQLSTGAVGGLNIESAGTGNLLTLRDTTATAVDVLTVANGGSATFRSQTDSANAFRFQDQDGNNIVRIDTVNDQLEVANGSAGTPAISFTADEDTGIYGNGADGLLFTNGGTRSLTLQSTGNAVFDGNGTFEGGAVTIGEGSTTDGALTLLNSTNAFGISVSAASQTTGSATVSFPDTAGVADTFCLLTAGNCVGVGGGGAIGGSGTLNTIPLFTPDGNNIGDSVITQSGTAISVAGTLSVVGSGSLSEAFGSGAVASGARSLGVGNGANASQDDATAIGQGSTASGTFSTALGRGANATANQTIAIGSSTASIIDAIAIGFNSSATTLQGNVALGSGATSTGGTEPSIALGYSADATGNGSVALGSATTASGNRSIAIGTNASNAGFANSVALGAYATNTVANQIVIGSVANEITDLYLGGGVTSFSAGTQDASINATSGNGTDIAGADLTLAAGAGTGTGAGGALLFQTAEQAGGSSAVLNTLTTRLTVQEDGVVEINSGQLAVSDGSSNFATIDVQALASDYTISIPTVAANDTFCLATLGNCDGSGVDNEFTRVVAASDSTNSASADYTGDGTNDEAQINSAIADVVAAGGGTVFLLEGTYNIEATIDLDSNVTLLGSGDGTLLIVPDGTNTAIDVISNTGTDVDMEIRNLTIDANDDGNSSTIKGIDIDAGTGTAATARPGITIDNVRIYDASSFAIDLNGSSHSTVNNVFVDSDDQDNTNYSFSITGINNQLTNSRFIDAGPIEWNSDEGRITDNYFELLGETTIGTLVGNGDNVIVSNNIFRDTFGPAIDWGTLGTRTQITGNVIDTPETAGIVINDSDYVVISNNTITNAGSEGIIAEDSLNIVISNNTITNYANTVTSSDGILLFGGDGDADNALITGNNISGSTSGSAIDISVSTADNTYLADNTLGGEGINDSGTNTIFATQLDSSGNLDLQAASGGNISLLDQTDVLQGTLTVGEGSTTDGLLTLFNSTNAFGVSISASAQTTGSATVSFPDTAGANDTFCLATLANCSAAAATLQGVYDNDADGGNATITLSAADDSLIVRNPASGGTDSLFVAQFENLETGNTQDGFSVIDLTSSGSFDTTSGDLTNYGLYVDNTSTESAGSNVLANYGIYASATGGDDEGANVGVYGTGNTGLQGVGTGGSLGLNTGVSGTGSLYGVTGLSSTGFGGSFNGEAAAIQGVVATTDTTADTTQGIDLDVTDTGVVTTGTDTTYGLEVDVTRTGATGGTINTTGFDLTVTGDAGGTSTATGLNVNVSGADTNYAALFNGGNVGIGTGTPGSALSVVGDTDISGALAVGSGATPSAARVIDIDESFTSSGTVYGIESSISSTPGSGTGGARGTSNIVSGNGTLNFSSIVGQYNNVGAYSSGTTSTLYGTNQDVYNNGGSATNIFGSRLYLQNSTGTSTNVYGDYQNLRFNGADATTAYGEYLFFEVQGASNITDAYGSYITNVGSGGTLDNFAGIAIEDQTTATDNTLILLGTGTIPAGDYSIYSATAYESFFAGNLTVDAQITSGDADTAGTVRVADGSGNFATIQTEGAIGGDYTVSIPTEISGADFFCLENAGNCSGTGNTLQQAYAAGNTITATDANNDIAFTLSEATNFSTNITGTGSILFQDGGLDILRVDDGGPIEVLSNTNLEVAEGNISTAFGGIGLINNGLSRSEELNDGDWTATNITVTANNVDAPNDETTAERLVSTAANGTLVGTVGSNSEEAGTFNFSIWLRGDTGGEDIDLRLDSTGGTPTTGTAANHILTTEWRRYDVVQTFTGAVTNIDAVIEMNNNSETIYAWGGQLTESANPGVYTSTSEGGMPFIGGQQITGAVINGRLNLVGDLYFGNGDANAEDYFTGQLWRGSSSTDLEINTRGEFLIDVDGTENAIIDLDSTGDFIVRDNGTTTLLEVTDSGNFFVDTDTLVVDAAGNFVGIGDASPANPLSINGLNTANAAAQAAIYTDGVGNIGLLVQGTSSQTADLVVVEDTSGNDYFVIDGVGNVGIGPATDPSYLLDIQDSGTNIVNIQSTDAGGTAGIRLSEDAGDVEIRYNGTNNVLEIVGSAADPGEFYFDRDRGYVEFGSGLASGLNGTFTDGDPVLATYSDGEENQLYIAASGTDVDAYVTVSDAASSNWSFGLDDSDSDQFKLSRGTVLGTNDYFSLSTAGLATFQGASVTVGTTSQAGSLILNDGDGETATIQTASLGSNETYILPDSDGSDTFCLLDLGNCSGSATTLQASYDADVDGSDAIIALTSADDSIIFRNPASGGTDSTYTVTVDQLNTGAFGGLLVNSAGTGNIFEVQDAGTTAFRIDDAGFAVVGSAGSIDVASDDGDLYVGDNLEVDGQATFTNTINLQNSATISNSVSGDIDFNGNLKPITNNNLDLGDSDSRWQDVYVGTGAVSIGADGDSGALSYLTASDQFNFDQSVQIDNNADASVSLTLDSGSTAIQNSDIIFNDQGTLEWTVRKDTSNNFLIQEADTGLDRLAFVNSGNTVIRSGADANSILFQDGASTNILAVNGSSDAVGIGTTSPTGVARLEVTGNTATGSIQSIANVNGDLRYAVAAAEQTSGLSVTVDAAPNADADGQFFGLYGAASADVGGTRLNTATVGGVRGNALQTNAGLLDVAVGGQFGVQLSGGSATGNISEAYGIQVLTPNQVSGATGDVVDSVGIRIAEQNTGTDDNINLLIGTLTIPNADYSIYNASSLDNYFAGNLGIGDATPDTVLDVEGAPADISEGSTLSVTGTATSTTNLQYGINSSITASPASAGVGFSAIYGYANATTANATDVSGAELVAENSASSGTLAALTGNYLYVNNSSTGTVTEANGLVIDVNNAGTITNLAAIDISNPINTGTIVDNQAILVRAQTSGIDNVGIQVGESTGTNSANLVLGQTTIPSGNFSLYSASAQDSYFAGDVGIGTSSPAAPLQVTNAVTAGLPAISSTTVALFERSNSGSTDASVSILSGNTGTASLFFGDTDAELAGRVSYSNSANELRLFNGANGLTVETDGRVGINNAAAGAFLSVNAGNEEDAAEFISADGRVFLELQDSVDSAFITNDQNFLALGGTSSVTDGLGVRVDLQAAGIAIGDGSGNYANIRSEALASNYNVDIPTITGDDTFCLETLNNCAGGTGTDDEFITVAADDSSTAKKAAADYTATASSSEDAINSAISAVNTAGGGTVYLMEGTYTIDATISLLDDVQIIGDGPQATIITVGATHNANLDFFSETTDPDNWAVRDLSIDINDDGHGTGNYVGFDLAGVGAVDARGGEISNVEIYDFNGTSDYGIHVSGGGADQLRITNSHFWDGRGAIRLTPSADTWDGIRITENLFENIDFAAIYNDGSDGVVISGNTFRDFNGTADQGAIDLIGAENNTITGNTFENLPGYGVESSLTDYNTTVTANTFRDVASAGIYGNFQNSTIVGNTLTNVGTDAGESAIDLVTPAITTVADNIIYNPNTDGISIDTGTQVTVTGNQIEVTGSNGIDIVDSSNEVIVSNNVIYQAGDNGVRIDASSNNIVSDNFVTQSGTSTATADGIHVSGNSDNNQIIGNQITDTAGTGSAIELAASTVDNTYLADNTFSGTGATSISDSGTNTIYANQTNGASTSTATDLILQPADNVGIGTTAPDAKLTVVESGSTPTGGYLADTVIVAQNTDAASNAYLSLSSAAGFETGIYFGDVDNADEALLVFDSGEDSGAGQLEYYADPTTFASFLIDSSGDVAITGQSTDSDDGSRLRVYNGSFTTWGALSAYTAGTDTVARFASDQSTINNAGIAIQAGTAANTFIAFGDTDDADIGLIDYDNNNNSLSFYTNNSEQFTIDSVGAAQFQTTSASTTAFQILGDSNENILVADSTGGENKIGFGDVTVGSLVGQVQIVPLNSGRRGLVLQNAVGQTENIFETYDSGGGNIRIRFDELGGAVFNDQGLSNADFVIESDTASNFLTVDADGATDSNGQLNVGGITSGARVAFGGAGTNDTYLEVASELDAYAGTLFELQSDADPTSSGFDFLSATADNDGDGSGSEQVFTIRGDGTLAIGRDNTLGSEELYIYTNGEDATVELEATSGDRDAFFLVGDGGGNNFSFGFNDNGDAGTRRFSITDQNDLTGGEILSVLQGGTVGIGDTTPDGIFDVTNTFTDTSGNADLVDLDLNVNPSSASTAAFTGVNQAFNVFGGANTAGATVRNFSSTGTYQATAGLSGISHYYANTGHFGTPGTLGYDVGLALDNGLDGSGITVNNEIGVSIEDRTTGTDRTNLLITTGNWNSAPSGVYSIYNSSTDNNYFAGNVGIGETAPSVLLDVAQTSTITSGTGTLSEFSLTVDPAADSSANYRSAYFNTAIAAADPQDYTSTVGVTGIRSRVTHGGTGNISGAQAGIFETYSTNTGTITSASGVEAQNISFTGTVSSASGGAFRGAQTLGATFTNSYGVRALEVVETAGSVVNSAGVQIDELALGTNNSNLLIGTSTIPSGQFSIYNSSTDNNYFAGNLGIANTNPGNEIQVGTEDTGTNERIVRIAGQETGQTEGGQLSLAVSADYDTTFDEFNLDAFEDDFRIHNNGTTKLIIQGDTGNIGIGDNTPDGALQVAGDEVRIGDAGTINWATGDGDLYVEDELEVDGNISIQQGDYIYFDSETGGNSYIRASDATTVQLGQDEAGGTVQIYSENFQWLNSNDADAINFALEGDGRAYFTPATDATDSFQVQNAAGQDFLTVDTESSTNVLKVAIGEGTSDVVFVLDSFNTDPSGTIPDGAMFYDADDDQFRCRVNGSWTNCINGGGGGTTTTATLIPEFAGGILSADGSNNSGTLSSDWVNGLSSGEGEQHNFYEWSTAQATAQDYDVVVRYQLPNNFDSMGAASTFSFWHEDPDGATTNANITWTVYDEVDETQCFSTTFEGTTAGVWEQETASTLGSCAWSAGDFVTMVFKIQTTSGAGAHRLGEVEFQYDI